MRITTTQSYVPLDHVRVIAHYFLIFVLKKNMATIKRCVSLARIRIGLHVCILYDFAPFNPDPMPPQNLL